MTLSEKIKAIQETNWVIEGIFKKFPDINLVIIEGYKPDWNDGSECLWEVSLQIGSSGCCYYSPCYQETQNKQGEFYELIKDTAPISSTTYQTIATIINNCSNLYEILDAGVNGTCWHYVRTPEGFKVIKTHFVHD